MQIKLYSKPLSVNKLYYANKRHGLRAESKEWQYNLFLQLSQYSTQLADLRSKFIEGQTGYKVAITYILPAPVLYNKAGAPSSKAADLSNCDKALIDVLFLPAHYGPNVPYQCENLNCDDKHLFELSSKKIPGQRFEILLDIDIIQLP